MASCSDLSIGFHLASTFCALQVLVGWLLAPQQKQEHFRMEHKTHGLAALETLPHLRFLA